MISEWEFWQKFIAAIIRASSAFTPLRYLILEYSSV